TPEEYAVYSVLFDEGPHAPTELARRTGMPATSMSHFVRSMLERGHAERAPSPADRRSYRIVLTPAGLAAHGAAGAAFAGPISASSAPWRPTRRRPARPSGRSARPRRPPRPACPPIRSTSPPDRHIPRRSNR